MSKIIHQKIITESDKPVWKDAFKKREYEYLTHVVNGLIKFGEFDEFAIQFGERNSIRAFHIFESRRVRTALSCAPIQKPN